MNGILHFLPRLFDQLIVIKILTIILASVASLWALVKWFYVIDGVLNYIPQSGQRQCISAADLYLSVLTSHNSRSSALGLCCYSEGSVSRKLIL